MRGLEAARQPLPKTTPELPAESFRYDRSCGVRLSAERVSRTSKRGRIPGVNGPSESRGRRLAMQRTSTTQSRARK